jgi:hypothetical protein
MVNNSTIINHHSLNTKKRRQRHLVLEMQVIIDMAWDRING